MYRTGLGSIVSSPTIHNQIFTQLPQKSTIKSDKITTQTLIISLNSMVGFAYLQRDERTILYKATKISISEFIDQLTGSVTYHYTTEFSERYGKPPVYVTTIDAEIPAAQYVDLKTHSLYESYQRREIWFTDNESGREYRLTTRENTLSIEMYSKVREADYSLPQWLYDVMHQEDGKYIKDYAETKAKWREKQEAAIAARKAEIQAKKDAEKARKTEERKAKAAAKKALEKEKKKANKSSNKSINAKKSPKKSSKVSDSSNALSEPKKRKKEETVADMWAEWRKGK